MQNPLLRVKVVDATAGYTGFIPGCDHNAQACHEASAVDQPRQDGEASTMLFTMDQYSRQRVPLYTGHRPTALSNLTAAQPAHGPTLQTTQVSSQLTKQHQSFLGTTADVCMSCCLGCHGGSDCMVHPHICLIQLEHGYVMRFWPVEPLV